MQSPAAYLTSQQQVFRYTGKAAVLGYYLLAIAVLASAIGFVYASDSARDFFDRISQLRDERRIMLNGLSLFLVVLLIDFLMQIKAFMDDLPALIVDEHGVRGLHGGLWREIEWDEILEVEITKRHIRFVRQPRGALTQLSFFLREKGWSRFRFEYCIHVLLKRIDGGREEIIRAIGRHRPDLLPR